MPKGEGRSVHLWVKPDHESTIRAARNLMGDLEMSFSAMVVAALEEYVTRHQPMPVDLAARRRLIEIREREEIKLRRVNGL